MNRLTGFLVLAVTKYTGIVTTFAKIEFQHALMLSRTFLAIAGRTICRSEARWDYQ